MLIIGSILLLLANAVTLRRDKSILFNRVAILILLYSGILAYDSLAIGSLDTGIGVFSGLFHSTAITHSFDIFIYIIGAVILQLTSFYPRRLRTAKLTSSSGKSKLVNKNEEQFLILEYPLVILFILIGATFLMSSSDLVSMFIAIELQSYGLYILATLYRNSELSTTAGLTYFLLGGLSSCFILLGSSLLYLNSGLTNLDGIYVLASLCDENKGVEAVTFIIDNGFIKTMNVNSQSFNLALLILIIGYLFKVSSAPFHFWSPAWWSGKLSMRDKLSNSGNTLELLVPSHSRKTVGGWSNDSCMVTSQKASEKNVGNRGSKSTILNSIAVKEQRVDGSWHGGGSSKGRCTLKGFFRNYRVKILTKANPHSFISFPAQRSIISISKIKHHPYFVTGFIDAVQFLFYNVVGLLYVLSIILLAYLEYYELSNLYLMSAVPVTVISKTKQKNQVKIVN